MDEACKDIISTDSTRDLQSDAFDTQKFYLAHDCQRSCLSDNHSHRHHRASGSESYGHLDAGSSNVDHYTALPPRLENSFFTRLNLPSHAVRSNAAKR